jgi:hypothetical protein
VNTPKNPAGYLLGWAVPLNAPWSDLPVAAGGQLAVHVEVAGEAGRHQVL